MPFRPLNAAPIGNAANQAIAQILTNPLVGTPFEHFRAQWLDDSLYDNRGRPDYLAENSGEFQSGVQYIANPDNPLRGIFCPIARRPTQDKPGIFYEAQMQLFVTDDLGEVFTLDEGERSRPKLQDRFLINSQTFYATQPAFACMQGEAIAAWRIDLALQRYPVIT